VLIVLLVLAWEIYAWNLNNQLLVPTFSATISIWWQGMLSGVLPDRAWTSLQGLAIGFTPGWRWRAS
jgi:NitT/TauT family transport system permease protein